MGGGTASQVPECCCPQARSRGLTDSNRWLPTAAAGACLSSCPPARRRPPPTCRHGAAPSPYACEAPLFLEGTGHRGGGSGRQVPPRCVPGSSLVRLSRGPAHRLPGLTFGLPGPKPTEGEPRVPRPAQEAGSRDCRLHLGQGRGGGGWPPAEHSREKGHVGQARGQMAGRMAGHTPLPPAATRGPPAGAAGLRSRGRQPLGLAPPQPPG